MTSKQDSTLNCIECHTSNLTMGCCFNAASGVNSTYSSSSSQSSDSQIIIFIVIPIVFVMFFCVICVCLAYRRKKSMTSSDQEIDNGTYSSSPRITSLQSLEAEIIHSMEMNLHDNSVSRVLNNTESELIYHENSVVKDENTLDVQDIIIGENKEGNYSFEVNI